MSLADVTGVEYVAVFLLWENMSQTISVSLNCTINGQYKLPYYLFKKFNKANYCVRKLIPLPKRGNSLRKWLIIWNLVQTFSRMDQVKFVEESL